MPTVSLKHTLLEDIQKFNGHSYDRASWLSDLSQIGVVVEGSDDTEIEIEVFPDRPDLLSHETMARASRSFLQDMPSPCRVQVSRGAEKMTVKPEMKNVRPHAFAAIVRGVYTGSTEVQRDLFVQSLMDHQEKLHTTLGRKRRSVSIGVHDISDIDGPFTVSSDDGSYSFVPLNGEGRMSLKDILTNHPKGIEYAHLVDQGEGFPLITDKNGKVISFPPIINGVDTMVTTKSTDFLIDVTGWDQRACISALKLIALSMSERGGKIESVEVEQYDGTTWILDMEPVENYVPKSLISMLAGFEPSDDSVAKSISRMGGKMIGVGRTGSSAGGTRWDGLSEDEPAYIIEMPSWRADILHPVDVVEDVIIGIGLNSLPQKNSLVNLPGSASEGSSLERRVRQSIRAMGAHEVQTLTLTNMEMEFVTPRLIPAGEITRIKNPITREHDILRQYILPSLFQVLSSNRHHELPHRIFELGTKVVDHINSSSVAWACAEKNAGFSSAKGYGMSLLRDLGTNDDDLGLVEGSPGVGPWIPGRVADVSIKGVYVGTFGEIAPAVSVSYGLRVPIHAGEFDMKALMSLLPDPLLN